MASRVFARLLESLLVCGNWVIDQQLLGREADTSTWSQFLLFRFTRDFWLLFTSYHRRSFSFGKRRDVENFNIKKKKRKTSLELQSHLCFSPVLEMFSANEQGVERFPFLTRKMSIRCSVEVFASSPAEHSVCISFVSIESSAHKAASFAFLHP